jgi:hypothetical protein
MVSILFRHGHVKKTVLMKRVAFQVGNGRLFQIKKQNMKDVKNFMTVLSVADGKKRSEFFPSDEVTAQPINPADRCAPADFYVRSFPSYVAQVVI